MEIAAERTAGVHLRTGRIVVGVDGSPQAVAALVWARGQARGLGVRLRVVTAWTRPGGTSFDGMHTDEDPTPLIAAEELLADALRAAEIAPEDDAVTTVRVLGAPAEVLVAESEQADLLVLGMPERLHVTAALRGSVCPYVAKHAACPVVLVRPDHLGRPSPRDTTGARARPTPAIRGRGRRLDVGEPVMATDGQAGRLDDVLLDPRTRRVTHLVVAPTTGPDRSPRLVPIGVATTHGSALRLSWAADDLLRAPRVETARLLDLDTWPHDGSWDVGVVRTFVWPRDDDGYRDTMPVEPGFDPRTRPRDGAVTVFDQIPAGTVEIRGASRVVGRHGHTLGHVAGLVLDDDHVISHLVLARGHLWARRRVTVPAGAVTYVVTDRVDLDLGRADLAAFPSIPDGVRRGHDRRR